MNVAYKRQRNEGHGIMVCPRILCTVHTYEGASACECSCMSKWMNRYATARAEYVVMCLCQSVYFVCVFYFWLFHHITETTATSF